MSFTINFRDIKKEEREKLRNSHFVPYYGSFYNIFKNSNIEVSEALDWRRPLIISNQGTLFSNFLSKNEEDDYKKGNIYIVKEGNAFLWLGDTNAVLDTKEKIKDITLKKYDFIKDTTFSVLDGEKIKNTVLKTKDILEKGITLEIFCEGDIIDINIDMVVGPKFIFRDNKEGFMEKLICLLPPGQMIVSGLPLGQFKSRPLILFKVNKEEINKNLLGRAEMNSYITAYSTYMTSKFQLARWRAWSLWTNDAEIKILHILFLYFMGELPLQYWEYNGKMFNYKTSCFRKPRYSPFDNASFPPDAFEVSTAELALFAGLRRQTVNEILKDKLFSRKSILKRKDLNFLLEIQKVKGCYRFSTPSSTDLLVLLQKKLSSLSYNKLD